MLGAVSTAVPGAFHSLLSTILFYSRRETRSNESSRPGLRAGPGPVQAQSPSEATRSQPRLVASPDCIFFSQRDGLAVESGLPISPVLVLPFLGFIG